MIVSVNESPIAVGGADQAVAEGVVLNLSAASFTDVDTEDIHTVEVDWGDGSATSTGAVRTSI